MDLSRDQVRLSAEPPRSSTNPSILLDYCAEVVKGISPKKLQAALQGSQILSTDRRGKHMWAVLGPSKHSLMLHYGMTGMLAAKVRCLAGFCMR